MSEEVLQEQKDRPEDAAGVAQRYLKEIESVLRSKQQEAFERTGKRIVNLYRGCDEIAAANDPSSKSKNVLYNILWSNVQILKVALFARLPKVVVERMHKTSDPIARLACLGAERATHYMIQSNQDRWFYAFKQGVEDRLLPGRGQAWLRYEVEWEDVTDGSETKSGDAEEQPQTKRVKPGSERVIIDPLCWLDFIHSPARNAFEIKWVARRVWMTREELKQRFGDEIGKAVKFDSSTEKKTDTSKEEKELNLQAEVWELEDYRTKKRIWVSKGYKDGPLDTKDDVLKMKDFFSCARIPLLATTTSDSIYPTPDFIIYERLFDELEFVNKRSGSMTECIRYVGAVAKAHTKDIKNILNLQDGQLWPVDNFANFAEKGGFKGVMDWLPFDRAIDALPALSARKAELENAIGKIMGIADILRAGNDPSETATATQYKGHFAVMQTEERKSDVERWCRDFISKTAEIIFEPGLFSDDTINKMVGVDSMTPEDQAIWPRALALLRDDRLRTFRVDVETDSTVIIDEQQDINKRLEFIQAIQGLISNIQNVAQFRPELVHPMIESAKFAIAAFRTGKYLEGAFDAAWQRIEDADAQAANAPQAAPPDYEGQKLQLQGQEIEMKGNIESQKLQLEAQKAQADFSLESQRVHIEGMKVMSQAQINQLDQELKQFKERFTQYTEAQRLELEKYKTVLDEKEKFLEEARLKQQELVNVVQESRKENESKQAPQPVIHVHTGGGTKEVKMARLPTGELVGHARELPDIGG